MGVIVSLLFQGGVVKDVCASALVLTLKGPFPPRANSSMQLITERGLLLLSSAHN